MIPRSPPAANPTQQSGRPAGLRAAGYPPSGLAPYLPGIVLLLSPGSAVAHPSNGGGQYALA